MSILCRRLALQALTWALGLSALPLAAGAQPVPDTPTVLAAPSAPPAHTPQRAPADPADNLGDMRWVLGAAFSDGPIYFGQQQRGHSLHPLFALRWRWLRISNSGSGGLLGETVAGGATADVVSNPQWKVRLGVRVDRGRRIEDDAEDRLADLPRVRSSLRGRLAVTHAWSASSSLSLTVSPDLLGRDGGTLVQLGAYKRLDSADWPAWVQALGGQWSAGAYLYAGDDRYMNSYFGVPTGARRFAPYEAEGGLRNASLGLGWQRSFGAQGEWVLFAGAGVDRLLGSAAKAPFVQRLGTWSANLGLAYRR